MHVCWIWNWIWAPEWSRIDDDFHLDGDENWESFKTSNLFIFNSVSIRWWHFHIFEIQFSMHITAIERWMFEHKRDGVAYVFLAMNIPVYGWFYANNILFGNITQTQSLSTLSLCGRYQFNNNNNNCESLIFEMGINVLVWEMKNNNYHKA